ncbi:MAG: integrase core domain-containing protein [Holosporaceae bacterium]|jgi:transposase InsO family protein|nr:integrase core domain-containing protein [Holosporaceae bacterium]
MAEFEDECKKFEIPLIVLPPRRPDYNGGVERGNRIFCEEFHNKNNLLANNLTKMRPELEKALWKYNNYRPHHHLNGATPMQYILFNNHSREVSPVVN